MTVGRRVLTALIAAAVALAPVGAAAAASRMLAAPTVAGAAQDHAAMPQGHALAEAGDDGSTPCCPGGDAKPACAQSCLQKCFGPLAVIAPARSVGQVVAAHFARPAAERPPSWSSAPQPPPPRA